MSVFNEIINELFWIPVGLFVAFIVGKYQKFTRGHRPKEREVGAGYLSSLPGEATEHSNAERNTKT